MINKYIKNITESPTTKQTPSPTPTTTTTTSLTTSQSPSPLTFKKI